MTLATHTANDIDMFSAKGPDDEKAAWVWGRFRQAQEKESANRILMRRDFEFYEGDQWDDQVYHSLRQRNRPALTINLVKPTIDTIIGIAETNRLDIKALPVGEGDNEGANIATEVLKYIRENCEGDDEALDALSDAVKGGIGWLEIDIRDRDNLREDLGDGNEYEPFWRRVDPEHVWRDPMGRRADGADLRWICRAMFLDYDECIAMWPKRKKDFMAMLGRTRQDYLADFKSQMEAEYLRPDVYGSVVDWLESSNDFIDNQRKQLLIIECQYKAIEDVQCVVVDGVTVKYDPVNQPGHMDLVHATADEDLGVMFPVVKKKIVRSAMTCGPLLLQDEPMGHDHNNFTLLPIIAHIDRKGNAYGIIRQLIDSQKDYNKRRSMSLLLLTVMRVLVETGAVKDMKTLARLANDPNAIIEVNPGALTNKSIEFQSSADLSPAHNQVMAIAKGEIEMVSGVNQQMKGQGPGDMSGVAMQERKESALTMLGPVFKNYKRALKRAAIITWSLARQYMTKPMMFRITEAMEPEAVRFINQDTATRLADIRANFTITEAPATATTRQANLNILMQLIQKLPPEVVMPLLPDLIQAHDIPNRTKMVATATNVVTAMGLMPGQAPPGMVPPGAGPPMQQALQGGGNQVPSPQPQPVS